MDKQHDCVCDFIKCLQVGQNITIVTNRGGQILLTFLEVKNNCVYGTDPVGRPIVLDCDCIVGIELSPTIGCRVDILSAAIIVCNDTINGKVTCNGVPVSGAVVTFQSAPSILTFSPNPIVTDSFGNFSVEVDVPVGTPETDVVITASTIVNGRTISTTDTSMVMCPSALCTLELIPSELPFNCTGNVFGIVTCGGQPIEGVTVNFSSSNPNFTLNPPSDITDSQGDVATGVNIASGTPSQTAVITGTATIGAQVLSTSITVTGSCASTCTLTLTAAPDINCTGTISGTLTCGGVPQPGVTINFTQFPEAVATIPSTTTSATGTFTTNVTVPLGTAPTSTIVTASATVGGQTVASSIDIDFSCPEEELCPCKFQLGVAGTGAPATANIINGGVPSTVAGTINVSAVQCYIAGPGCNPAVDNFSITFSGGSFTFNLIQGRRIRISCIDGTGATLEGTATASGTSTLQGLFDVFIGFTLSGNTATWNILATNSAGDSFSTTFTSAVTPQTAIGDCGTQF
ncbi:hypothetical protein IHV10_13340 [Fictibacillus sp. 5RED26]|uniref:hypothetical protein n=1 Tax=Fictibacillus sp. 5RED26 TaxID=2745876 RepID=UPI0018CF229F|nr:hypothetical protein [Fictibacillus sp. 5RED26]MBH0157357.1 hypothetical protein [Fictibacillus sp. 5RED26]